VAVSPIGLGITGLLEIGIALLSGSVGLLGDALHNLADVSTSLVVFVGFRVSKRPAGAANPYGFERAEDLAGLGVALAIWASASARTTRLSGRRSRTTGLAFVERRPTGLGQRRPVGR
jgi:divalent metal cation (Fe/Co/Zn/Cd) transporter